MASVPAESSVATLWYELVTRQPIVTFTPGVNIGYIVCSGVHKNGTGRGNCERGRGPWKLGVGSGTVTPTTGNLRNPAHVTDLLTTNDSFEGS